MMHKKALAFGNRIVGGERRRRHGHPFRQLVVQVVGRIQVEELANHLVGVVHKTPTKGVVGAHAMAFGLGGGRSALERNRAAEGSLRPALHTLLLRIAAGQRVVETVVDEGVRVGRHSRFGGGVGRRTIGGRGAVGVGAGVGEGLLQGEAP